MDIFFNTVPFIAAILVVVFFHELGHLVVGRMCGIKADVFSIGFGKELFSLVDKSGTKWRVAAVPLGGYVKFDLDSYDGASLWRRSATVAAGPLANFVLAIVLIALYFMLTGATANPFMALFGGVHQTASLLQLSVVTMFSGGQDVELVGPIGLAQIVGSVAKSGVLSFVALTAFLSVQIGLINLFPVPLMDGGRLASYAIEAIKGSPVGDGIKSVTALVGLFIIVSLMLITTYSDIQNLL